MKMSWLVLVFAVTFSLSAFAKRGDTDVRFCDEIRAEALENCRDELTAGERRSCYRDEVLRMVDEFNDETADLVSGGKEFCAF